MKLYVTKYALTKGILEFGRYSFKKATAENHFYAGEELHKISRCHFVELGVDAFFDKKSAIIKASDMRAKKIKSLEKQIAKLNGMEFK